MAFSAEVSTKKGTQLYSEALSLSGYGKYNLYILLATGGCLMCVIIETMCMSFILPAAQCDLDLSLSQKGVLVSIGFLGVMTTSHFWGFMADFRGRKNIMIFCLVTSSLVSLVCSIVPWSWLFILLRFCNGALISGASSIVYSFAGEYHDDKYRPMVISWLCSFVAAGQIYIPGLAWSILPSEWSYEVEALGLLFRPWRLLLIVYALPSLIVSAMLSILPESPKFLLAQGKHDETLQILTKMFVVNTGKKAHEYPVSTIVLDEVQEKKADENANVFRIIWDQTATLFNKQYCFKTILICYLQFGVFLSASALSLWFPQIINTLSQYAEKVSNAGVTLCGSIDDQPISLNKFRSLFYEYSMWSDISTLDKVCDDHVDTGVYLVVLCIGAAIGATYIIIGILINHLGKKKLLVGFAATTAICGLVAQYISGYQTILILCGIYLLISSLVGVVNALAVDLYPTSIRAMAVAVSLMCGRLGATIGSNVVGIIFYSYCELIFIFFAVNHVLIIVAAILLPTKKLETKKMNFLE
ncbi:unnamed protein product [Ceutorhynchus assimilis]|uniref:Major facilitator superfamily (MFS) profile domain-containing protein n=1 Tax=Ceutorhynchus assimilis TaxID=467358 RepID=A0A9N9MZW6_9CUCU|nr:unnamed protein product [Ceutorhynchus assimilis]